MTILYSVSNLLRDRFLLFLLLFSYFSIQITYSKYEVCHLKMFGARTEGMIESIEISKTNSFKLRYSYKVNGKIYKGSKYYELLSYDAKNVKQIRKKIISKLSYPVYYDSKEPERAVCFITGDSVVFPYIIWMVLFICWGIFIIRYIIIKK